MAGWPWGAYGMQQGGFAMPGADADADKKKKKKKKKKKRNRSGSSSDSSEVSDWRQKVWSQGWQGMWQQMMQGQMAGQMGQWPDAAGSQEQMPPPPPAPGGRGGSLPVVSHWGDLPPEEEWGGGGGGDRRGGDPDPAQDIPIYLEPSIEDFVPVPKAVLGKVIGKQAQTIIEIREKSGAFKVDARDQTSDPCQVKIAGTAEAVAKARKLIEEIIESTKTKNAGSEFVEIPRAKIGMVIGLKGSQVNQIQQDTGTKIDVDFDTDPCKCFLKGEPSAVEAAKKILLTIAMQIEDGNSEYLDLPKQVSGVLIGSAGSKVREFQEQSGARIDVDKTGNTCRVRLTGTAAQVANAKQLIRAEIEQDQQQQKLIPMIAPVREPMVVPAHQPNSFPATLSESIARAKAAAQAVSAGLITRDQPFVPSMGPPPAPSHLPMRTAPVSQGIAANMPGRPSIMVRPSMMPPPQFVPPPAPCGGKGGGDTGWQGGGGEWQGGGGEWQVW